MAFLRTHNLQPNKERKVVFGLIDPGRRSSVPQSQSHADLAPKRVSLHPAQKRHKSGSRGPEGDTELGQEGERAAGGGDGGLG